MDINYIIVICVLACAVALLKEIKDFIRSRGSHITQSKTDAWIAYQDKQGTDISSFSNEQQKYMEKYLSLDKITLIKLLAERDRNVEETTKTFEKQSEKEILCDKWRKEIKRQFNEEIGEL